MKKWNMFSYLVTQLIAWSDEVNSVEQRNSLTKLKLIKLLFFVSAADQSNGPSNLLAVFNNFYAMPYGHVESDIYNEIVNRGILDYSFANSMKLEASEDDKRVIQSAVGYLRKQNNDLIKYTANELVDLSHEWHSWKSVYGIARTLGKYSMKIPVEVIEKERKFYHL
ncbi:Panacea domain-containing protein [Hymenobacter crusticola]|uniref:Uncharacterized protein n=1 Tax=Hymenobacter crusticola TaxID=1770526 RepID=A0A243W635_9BACT|nr:type II toxin-antitoxin system antitoxin SocA domain-containing protein [Hymenobacter crusticola]OUJ68976.1 hypothetical protein BXP70_27105 [Hymenobacter crusticola]